MAWLARNEDGTLEIFENKPTLKYAIDYGNYWECDKGFSYIVNFDATEDQHSYLHFLDEPIEI